MLTLYGNVESGNDYKVRLLLAHLGIAWRRVEVWQTRGEPRSPAFLAINPIGKIPVVVFDDGRVLTESNAILYHLAQETRWWPGDGWARAQALRWMFFEQYSHEPRIAVNRYILRFGGDVRALADRVRENAEKGAEALAAMEAWLAGHSWFAGDVASIADIALYAYTHVADEGGFDLAPWPAVRGWLERVAGLPGHVDMHDERPVEIEALSPSPIRG